MDYKKNIIPNKNTIFLAVFILALFLTGCTSKKNEVYFEAAVSETETTDNAEAAEDTAEKEEQKTEKEYCVYICGAVVVPGVYMLPEGSRIYEAIQLAGGLTENASKTSINQAEYLSDGQMIRIPTIEEEENSGNPELTEEQPDDGKININTASATELMTLPGVGASKAEAIIAYREKNGGFATIEDIMKIDGIKEGVFHRIEESIKVN